MALPKASGVTAPLKPEASVPVKPGAVPPVKPGTTAPVRTEAVAAVKPAAVAPVKNGTTAPVKAMAVAPGKPGAVAPVDNGTTAPVKAVAVAPVKPAALAPVKNGTTAPVKAVGVAPVKSGAVVPVKNGTTALVKAVDVAPVKPGAVAPVRNGTTAPVKAVGVASVKPGAVAPVKNGTTAPVKPGAVAPLKPVQRVFPSTLDEAAALATIKPGATMAATVKPGTVPAEDNDARVALPPTSGGPVKPAVFTNDTPLYFPPKYPPGANYREYIAIDPNAMVTLSPNRPSAVRRAGEWIPGRATYYGSSKAIEKAYAAAGVGEPGMWGVIEDGSCGFTEREGASGKRLPYPIDMYAAAADTNIDYPGSCGRCYQVRRAGKNKGRVNEFGAFNSGLQQGESLAHSYIFIHCLLLLQVLESDGGSDQSGQRHR